MQCRPRAQGTQCFWSRTQALNIYQWPSVTATEWTRPVVARASLFAKPYPLGADIGKLPRVSSKASPIYNTYHVSLIVVHWYAVFWPWDLLNKILTDSQLCQVHIIRTAAIQRRKSSEIDQHGQSVKGLTSGAAKILDLTVEYMCCELKCTNIYICETIFTSAIIIKQKK